MLNWDYIRSVQYIATSLIKVSKHNLAMYCSRNDIVLNKKINIEAEAFLVK